MEYQDDIVYPVHTFDGIDVLHDVHCAFLRFDGVIDPNLLKGALWKVLDTGDWRKLGGRLRRRNGQLEFHAPKEYTAHRPPLNWDHEINQCNIADHPLAGRFPHGDKLSITTPPADVLRLGLAPHFPHSISDMIDKDVPQLSFKLTTFTNATLLATTYPHISWDGFGFLEFMRMVQLVLQGQESEIVPLLGAKTDIMEEIVRPHMTEKDASGIKSSFMPSNLPSNLPSPASLIEQRIIAIPLETFGRLQNRLRQEKFLTEDDNDIIRPSDIFLAWLVRQIVEAEANLPSFRLVNLLNTRVLVEPIWKAKGVYCQNMMLPVPNDLGPDVASWTVNHIIGSQQECFAKVAGKDLAGAYLSGFWDDVGTRFKELMLDGSRCTPVLMNNLSMLSSHLNLDLSRAMASHDVDVNRSGTVGSPTMVYVAKLSPNQLFRSVLMHGNVTSQTCWLSATLSKSTWDAIQIFLESL